MLIVCILTRSLPYFKSAFGLIKRISLCEVINYTNGRCKERQRFQKLTKIETLTDVSKNQEICQAKKQETKKEIK